MSFDCTVAPKQTGFANTERKKFRILVAEMPKAPGPDERLYRWHECRISTLGLFLVEMWRSVIFQYF